VATAAGAATAVSTIATAISTLGDAQATVGTLQNRLQFAMNLAQAQIVNTKAAESRIRDANIAEESANLTRYSILTQSGIAALAQANQSIGSVLALMEVVDFEAAVAAAAAQVPLLVVTRSEKGAIAIANGKRVSCAAEPIDKVVDTTGAGDLFAAGFLTGQAQGKSLEQSLRLGAICAAEIISHYGARPMCDMQALVAEKMG